MSTLDTKKILWCFKYTSQRVDGVNIWTSGQSVNCSTFSTMVAAKRKLQSTQLVIQRLLVRFLLGAGLFCSSLSQ